MDETNEQDLNEETEKSPVAVKSGKASKANANWIPDKFSGMKRTGTKLEYRKPTTPKKRVKKKK